jgi:hypothetical protein
VVLYAPRGNIGTFSGSHFFILTITMLSSQQDGPIIIGKGQSLTCTHCSGNVGCVQVSGSIVGCFGLSNQMILLQFKRQDFGPHTFDDTSYFMGKRRQRGRVLLSQIAEIGQDRPLYCLWYGIHNLQQQMLVTNVQFNIR